ncbi:MAG: GAF domain-containing protein [Phycisphaerae bacterium]
MSQTPIRVLLVEDNPGDASLVREALRDVRTEGFALDHRASLAEGIEAFESGDTVDAVLLDLTLGDSNGLQTVERMRTAAPHAPIIVMTGLADEAMGVAAMQRGAQDYIVKGQADGTLLARAIKYAIERQRTMEALALHSLRLELLSQTAGRLLASNEPQKIVEEIARKVMEFLDCQAFFNFLLDEKAGRLRLNACAGIPEETARGIQWLDMGIAVCGCVARDGRRIVAEDIQHTRDPRVNMVRALGIQAYACHPLMIGGKVIGTLSFGARNRTSFTPDELDVMKTVTDQVAIAMERIRLMEVLEQRVKDRTAELVRTVDVLEEEVAARRKAEQRVTAANSLLSLFAKTTTRKEYLQGAVDLIQKWTGSKAAGIRVVDDRQNIPYEAQVGFCKRFCEKESMLCIRTDRCVCVRVINGKPLPHDAPMMTAGGSFFCPDTAAFVNSLAAGQAEDYRGACVKAGFKTVAVIPIQYRHGMLGAIHLADPEAGKFQPDMVEFLEMLSPLIGEALQRFSVEEALRASEEHFRSLSESSQDCIARLSRKGEFLSMNPAGMAACGFAGPMELAGRKCADMILENRKGFELALELAAGGQTVSVQHKSTGEGGREIWWDSKLAPINGPEGQTEAVLLISRDATERRRLEREIVEISDKERRRIGHDLHDSLGQLLTGVAFLSKVMQQRLRGQSRPEAADAGQISTLVNQAVNQTRLLSRGLCPVEPKADGLMTALKELAANVAKLQGVPCEFACEQPIALNDDYTATQLYHIALEAVNNAVKHSRAEHIRIELAATDGSLAMTIRDDGVGMPAAAGDHADLAGMGLRTMRYRAGMIGAALDVGRAGRRGTAVTCTIAARKPAAAQP